MPRKTPLRGTSISAPRDPGTPANLRETFYYTSARVSVKPLIHGPAGRFNRVRT